MVVVDEAGQHAMEAADKCKIEGIIIMPTVVLDPPETGGFEAVPKNWQVRPTTEC